jgi:hypothetical protein
MVLRRLAHRGEARDVAIDEGVSPPSNTDVLAFERGLAKQGHGKK